MMGDDRLLEIIDGRQRCRQRTEVYSRVCGFFRPVQQWNKGKREEYRERVEFVVDHKPTGGEPQEN